MPFSIAFGSCVQPHTPVRFDYITSTCKAYYHLGDYTYMDGGAGFAGTPYNGESTQNLNVFPATGSGCTFSAGAATTKNGVAGQLPTGTATLVSGGTGYPKGQTIDMRVSGQGGSGAWGQATVNTDTTATFTVSIATPAVVTSTAHGFNTNQPITLSTTGALPTGLATATTYYVKVVNANTFNLATTPGGASINTSGTQSGVHTYTGVASGQVNNVILYGPGKGYTNTATANFSIGDYGGQATHWLRRADQILTLSGWQDLFAARNSGFKVYQMPDDHERSNNFDFSIAQGPVGATTLAHILDYWRVSNTGLVAVNTKYFDNLPTAGRGDIPPSLVGITGSDGTAVAAADFPWWSVYHDYDNHGNLSTSPKYTGLAVRVLVPDCISGKAPQFWGSTGTCTISQATPAVITATAHSLQINNPVIFSTTGSLPAGITAGTTYYVNSVSSNTFTVAASQGGATINTTSAGSGTHSWVNMAKVMWGSIQEAWIYAACADAVAQGVKHILMMSSKDLFNLDNQDGWAASAGGGNYPYTPHRNRVLATIESNNWPVIWMCGDRHCAHAAMTSTANGDAFSVFSICPTPLGSLNNTNATLNIGNTPYPEMVWQHRKRDQLVHGVYTWDDANQQSIMQVIDNSDNVEEFAVTIPAGSRLPVLPTGIRQLRN